MSDAPFVTRVPQLLVDMLPKRVHQCRLDRRQGRCRTAGIDEFRGQLLGAQPFQGPGPQGKDPQLFWVLGVGVEILPTPLKASGFAQSLPAGGVVTGAPKTRRIDE